MVTFLFDSNLLPFKWWHLFRNLWFYKGENFSQIRTIFVQFKSGKKGLRKVACIFQVQHVFNNIFFSTYWGESILSKDVKKTWGFESFRCQLLWVLHGILKNVACLCKLALNLELEINKINGFLFDGFLTKSCYFTLN